MLQLRCIFTICHPPRQGHPGIICNLSSPNCGPQSGIRMNWSLCNSVQLEDWIELWTQSQFVSVGLGLQTNQSIYQEVNGLCRVVQGIYPACFTPAVESRVTWWPDFPYEKKTFNTLYLLSSSFFLLSLLSSILQYSEFLSSTYLFSSFVKTETKCLLHLNHHLAVFHHALKWIPIHFKPV